jgi:hypothetical protein
MTQYPDDEAYKAVFKDVATEATIKAICNASVKEVSAETAAARSRIEKRCEGCHEAFVFHYELLREHCKIIMAIQEVEKNMDLATRGPALIKYVECLLGLTCLAYLYGLPEDAKYFKKDADQYELKGRHLIRLTVTQRVHENV